MPLFLFLKIMFAKGSQHCDNSRACSAMLLGTHSFYYKKSAEYRTPYKHKYVDSLQEHNYLKVTLGAREVFGKGSEEVSSSLKYFNIFTSY